MTRRPARRVYDLTYDRTNRYWKLLERGNDPDSRYYHGLPRRTAIEMARAYCRELQSLGALVQLVVHRMDGRIAFEATYGKDPARYPS